MIKDIETDKQVALKSTIERETYRKYEKDEFFFKESSLEPAKEDLSKPRVKPQDASAEGK